MMAKYALEEETVHDLNMSHHSWAAWGSDSKVGLCPCLASTSWLWLRVRAREVVGPESLAIQGFDCSRQLTTSDGAPAAQRYTHLQRMNLAGSSFCGFVVAALMTALFACVDWSTASVVARAVGGGDEEVGRHQKGAEEGGAVDDGGASSEPADSAGASSVDSLLC